MTDLILASTSPARRALMDALGLAYRVERPEVDEVVPAGTPAQETVRLLAERKARAVFSRHPGALVLGADQVVVVGSEVLGKPPNRGAARAQLEQLSVTPHVLLTGVCLLGPGFSSTESERTEIALYPFAPGELERYLDTGEWEGCAGAYRVESVGQWLMQRIDGDRTNVQGLPMQRVVRMLRAAGVRRF